MTAHTVFLDWLFRTTWQSALLILLVLLAQRLLRRQLSATWRHALWLVVVARLALPFSPASPASLFNLLPGRPPAPTSQAAAFPAPLVNLLPRPDGPKPTEFPAAVGPEQTPPALHPPLAAKLRDIPAAVPTATAPVQAPGRDWQFWLFGIWGVGVVLMTGLTIGFIRRAHRRLSGAGAVHDAGVLELLTAGCRAMGVRRPPRLRETPAISSPVLCGWFRPCIMLPAGLQKRFTERELRFVLLHELAHLKRGDLALNWLLTALQLVHWFNPLVWLAFARMRADRELACDAMALSVAGEGERRGYGETLLRLLEGLPRSAARPGLVGILEDHRRLKERLEYIARFRRPPRWSAWAGLLVAGLAVVGLTDAQRPDKGNNAPPSTLAKPVPGPAGETYTPLVLDRFQVTRWDSIRPGASWDAVPKGRQTLDGVPFELGGLIELSGLGALEDNKGFPSRVSGIPIGRRATALHLIHGTGYTAPDGTLIGKLVLHYAGGKTRELPLRYGVHVRNWWVARNEASAALSDPNSRVAWTGSSPETDRFGVTLRLFHTRLANPLPDQRIVSLDVISALSRATPVIVGLTLESGTPNPKVPATPTAQIATELPAALAARELAVRVVDQDTGDPLPGARVSLWLAGQQKELRFGAQRTDAQGRVVLDFPTDGPKEGTVFVRARDHQPGWRELRTLDQPEGIEIQLAPGARIGGIVTDPEGTPIAGALVRINAVEEIAPARPIETEIETVSTDAIGRWNCTSAPSAPKGLSFVVIHPDFFLAEVEQAVDDHPDPDAPTAKRLLAGKAVFTLDPGLIVAGTVTDPDGKPVAEANLLLAAGNFLNHRRTGRSDAAGRFRLTMPETGRAKLLVQAPGWAPELVSFELVRDLDAPLPIRLERGRTIRGRVLSADAKPLAQANVTLTRWRNTSLLSWHTKTDPEGRFTWKSAPTDKLKLLATKAGYEPGGLVFPKDATNEVIVRLFPPFAPFEFNGKVVDAETGEAITNYFLLQADFYGTPEPPSTFGWHSASHLRRQENSFTVVPNSVSRNQFVRFAISVPGYSPEVTPAFPKQGKQAFTFRLKHGKGPSGVVVTAAGRPVAGADVALLGVGYVRLNAGRLRPSPQRVAWLTMTDAAGQFELPALLPKARLVATHPEQGYGEISASELAVNGRFLLQPWGRVEGVLRIGNRPGVGQNVTVTPRRPWPVLLNYDFDSFSDHTDAEGHFAIGLVPPGPRRLVRAIPKFRGWVSSHSLNIDVLPGAVTRVTYGGTGRPVIGHVVLSDPKRKIEWARGGHFLSTKFPEPPAGQEFQRWRQSPEYRAAMERRRTYALQWGDDGSFRVDDVEAGEYVLHLRFTVDYTGRTIGTLTHEFTVPEMPDGRSDEPLDLGELKVQVQNSQRTLNSARP